MLLQESSNSNSLSTRIAFTFGVCDLKSRICATGVLLLVLVAASPFWSQNPPNSVPAQASEKVHNGNKLYDKGEYAEAVREYESAMTLAPAWYEPHYELAQSYGQMKRPDDARKEYEIALGLDPKCWLCYQGLGNLADDLGDHNLALQHYQKSVDLAPDQGQPRYNLAITYVRLKKIDEAISALKEAERLKPDYASPYFLLGKIYYSQQKYYLAFDQLFQATKLEKSGARFDQAKKLIDVQITVDNKLEAGAMGNHLAYCLARSGSISPEEYRKRFPGAETYIDDLHEEEYVLESLATMVGEFAQKKKVEAEFGRLVAINKAGYLKQFILSSESDRLAKDLQQYQQQNPGGMEDFRKWAAANKISTDAIHPRCEVRWMGQTW
jgi:tetratricopeptide (TPR) repeat protein